MDEIKVGDKIYIERFGKPYSVEIVTRITKTLIRSANHNYRRPSPNSMYLAIMGQDTWSTMSGWRETPERKELWREHGLKQWIEQNWHKIPIEDIDALRNKLEKKL